MKVITPYCRTAHRYCAFILLWLITACASLPSDYEKQPSHAIRNSTDSALAQKVTDLQAPYPGKSGFRPLPDGIEALSARLILARKAQVAIDVQYYYILADITGNLLVKELVDAADRGVRVRILLDDISTKGYEEMFAALSARPNIEIRLANPAAHRKSRVDMATNLERLDHRMHNKSITYDNAISIVGGRNIGTEYFGANSEFNYYDLDVLAVGPVADQVSSEFDLYWNAEETLPVTAFVEPDRSEETARELQQRFDNTVAEAKTTPYAAALQSTVVDMLLAPATSELVWAPAEVVFDLPYGQTSEAGEPGPEVLGNLLLQQTANAEEELFIISPYFVPDEQGMEQFRQLRAKGVRCVVVTNSLASTDVAAVYGGYRDYQAPLLALGVELWELMAFPDIPGEQRGTTTDRRSLHAKTFAIDRRKLFVGSFNWDGRSRKINTEMGVLIDSPELATGLVDSITAALPGTAWQLRLNDKGQVEWVDVGDKGQETVFNSPPQSSSKQRLEANITDIKAVEKEL